MVERQVAYKTTIDTINKNPLVIKEGWEPNYIDTPGKRISRVNLMGVIINKNNDNEWILDDGTGKIRVRGFEKENPNIKTGDSVMVIGRPRKYGEEKYILYEIIKKVDKKWLLYRKKELGLIGETKKKEEKNIDYKRIEVPEENLFIKIITIIKELDKKNNNQGADIEEIIKKSGSVETEHIINSLIAEGEIFEIKKGVVKTLD